MTDDYRDYSPPKKGTPRGVLPDQDLVTAFRQVVDARGETFISRRYHTSLVTIARLSAGQRCKPQTIRLARRIVADFVTDGGSQCLTD